MQVDVRGRNHVNVTGEGSRTIMFAHGFGCDQNMWRYTPSSTLRVMQATGHCPHISEPAETVALIREYLDAPGV
jgi:pimeloyl-ACP methyl ester carboxylesterase